MIIQEGHGTQATASTLIEEHEVLAPDSPREAIAPLLTASNGCQQGVGTDALPRQCFILPCFRAPIK